MLFSVQVMLDFGLEVVIDGSGCVIQGSQQITANIAYLRGCFFHAVKDILDMRLLQSPETVLDCFDRQVLAANPNGSAGAAQNIGYQVNDFFQLVKAVYRPQLIVLDALFDFGSAFASIHPITLRWIDR